jgi:hypothetical protein
MRRCWLKGQTGDALHAVLCATGYNLRWLLRAIVRLGLGPTFFGLARLHWIVNVPSHPLLAWRDASGGPTFPLRQNTRSASCVKQTEFCRADCVLVARKRANSPKQHFDVTPQIFQIDESM